MARKKKPTKKVLEKTLRTLPRAEVKARLGKTVVVDVPAITAHDWGPAQSGAPGELGARRFQTKSYCKLCGISNRDDYRRWDTCEKWMAELRHQSNLRQTPEQKSAMTGRRMAPPLPHAWGPGPDGPEYHCQVCGISKVEDHALWDTCESWLKEVKRREEAAYLAVGHPKQPLTVDQLSQLLFEELGNAAWVGEFQLGWFDTEYQQRPASADTGEIWQVRAALGRVIQRLGKLPPPPKKVKLSVVAFQLESGEWMAEIHDLPGTYSTLRSGRAPSSGEALVTVAKFAAEYLTGKESA